MHGVLVPVLLASIVQAHVNELMVNHDDVQDTVDQVFNKMLDNIFDRVLKTSPLHDADLDSATLAKTHPDVSRALLSPALSRLPIAQSSIFPAAHSQLSAGGFVGGQIEPVRAFQGAHSVASCSKASMGRRMVSCSAKPKVSVGLVGFGLVGKELIDQIESGPPNGLDISVLGVARSSSMSLGDGAPKKAAAGDGEPTDLVKLGEFMSQQPGAKVIVDCTADDGPSEYYDKWLAAGINVVTPNKKMGSGPLSRYKATFDAGAKGGSTFYYEATVGAGLPIITTLQDLIRTGDKVLKIEGIFSGTLSYLFNEGAGKAFSDVVQDAADKGFTEPDPRDDLSGTDVQRKTVILARECGLDIEMDDVPVESLVPGPLQSWQPTDAEKAEGLSKVFIAKMKEYDGDMAKRMEEAAAAGEVLRYVGSIDVANKKATVGLGRFPTTHPFAATQYADNIVSYATERYTPRPLVVQGPGAGAAVTAGGVFADVLRAGVGTPA